MAAMQFVDHGMEREGRAILITHGLNFEVAAPGRGVLRIGGWQ